MNTAVNTVIKNDSDLAKNRTLKALFQVICADNEFTLLRHTLELYCEEIEAATMEPSKTSLTQVFAR